MQSVINPSTPDRQNWFDFTKAYSPFAQERVQRIRIHRLRRASHTEPSLYAWFEAHRDLASKAGLVACVLLYALTAAYGLSLTGQWRAARQALASATNDLALEAGFGVKAVQVEGRRNIKDEDIAAALGARDGVSIFAFDTDAARDRLKANGWVAEARVMRLLPSTLVVELEERKAFALWSEGGKTAIIDAEGKPLGLADPKDFPQLPIVSGAGAATPAKELLDTLAALPELKPRIREMERIAGRRWDLVLDTGLRVKLPTTDYAGALTDLAVIAAKNPAAFYEMSEMDFRIPSQFTVRLKDSSDKGRARFLSWLSSGEHGASRGL
ncbi:MAG: FtsQ-type POTRA domain-containing protein [Rhodomicrobium sp.]|nr:FtsQ-type POTRA domain-containing protein [Rhodomicrobium sp.]